MTALLGKIDLSLGSSSCLTWFSRFLLKVYCMDSSVWHPDDPRGPLHHQIDQNFCRKRYDKHLFIHSFKDLYSTSSRKLLRELKHTRSYSRPALTWSLVRC